MTYSVCYSKIGLPMMSKPFDSKEEAIEFAKKFEAVGYIVDVWEYRPDGRCGVFPVYPERR